jgi:hypothetical protein
MSNFGSIKLIDELGVSYGVKHVNNKPRVSSMPYLYDIAEENVANHEVWTKIGFTPTMTTAESDLWSLAGVYVPPPSAMQMEVVSSNNTDDIGAILFSGNSSGGSTTTLEDATKNFLGGTAVAIGDTLLLDTTHEYGFVTAVGATTITCDGGFSEGGSGVTQAYRVVDYSNTAGAHVVDVGYLNGSYVSGHEFIVLNGTTEVATVATTIFRINSFRVIGAGANGKPTGNLSLRETDNVPTYSYISAGYTRARNIHYTVPVGKTLYVTTVTVGYGYSTNQTHYCRLYTRATQNNGFRTPGIFYPFTEIVCANTSQRVELTVPTQLVEKVDIKVSGIATFSGIASVALRGWLENM